MEANTVKTTDHVLDFILNTKYDNIPEEVRHQGKRCLLDTMGALVAGTTTPVARLSADVAMKFFQGDDATLMVNGAKVSAAGASLANGFASNALDVEHGYRPAQGRPGACLVPVLLASSEMMRMKPSGRDLLVALIVGYEIAMRAGMMLNADPANVYTSGAWGATGAVAGAGRLLNVSPEIMREALGAANYHGPIGLIAKGVATPCMAKDGVGWGALVAMMSILLAQNGFTAPKPELDSIPGLMDELGKEFRISGLYFKPFCCCRWVQAAITGSLGIVRDHRIEVSDIAALRIRTFAKAASLSREHPTHTDAAQYNMTYPVAVALHDGCINGDQVLSPRIFDERVLGLADMIEVEVAEEFENRFPAKTFSEVIITTKSGQKYTSGELEPLWEPPHSPTDDDLMDKFRRLAEPVVGNTESERLLECLWNIDSLDSMQPIFPHIFNQKGGLHNERR